MATATQQRSDDDVPAPRRGWAIMTALILAELVSSFEASMIYSALKQFYTLFDDPVGIGWLLTGFMLVASASAGICSRLGDIYGRKKLLIFCCGGAMVGSLISAASTELLWITIGRSCQGLAGAILPLCYGMVKEYFPGTKAGTNIGLVAATASGGAGIGMIVGGVLVDHGSWHHIFLASAALAAAAIVAVLFLVPPSRQFSPSRIDWIGGILFLPGLVFLLYGLGVGEQHGWGGPEQLIPMGIGAAVLTVWVIYEARVSDPLIDVRMLLNRQIGVTLIITMLFLLGTANIGQMALLQLQQPTSTGVGLGLSATLVGILHSPAALLGTIASSICGWYAGRNGGRGAMILATGLASLAWIGLTLAHSTVSIVVFWMLLSAFALGAMMAAMPNLIVEAAPAGRTSEATGLAQIGRKLAMASGAQMVAILLSTSTVRAGGGSFPDEEAYTLTYGVVAFTLIAAFLLSFLLPKRGRRVLLRDTDEAGLNTAPTAA